LTKIETMGRAFATISTCHLIFGNYGGICMTGDVGEILELIKMCYFFICLTKGHGEETLVVDFVADSSIII